MKTTKCPECGYPLQGNEARCPECDCPLQSVEKKQGTNTAKIICGLFAIVGVCGLLFFGLTQLSYKESSADNGTEVTDSENPIEEIRITTELAEAVRRYGVVRDFHGGLSKVSRNGNWGFINTKGEEIVLCQYDYVEDFFWGCAQVLRNGKLGFINTKGEEVIPCKYDQASNFSEGLAKVCRNDKWGFVNTKGEEVIPCKYDRVNDFSEGLAAVKDGKWGFVNTKGEEIVPCQYGSVKSFTEGLAVVQRNNKWGYVDKYGNSTFTAADFEVEVVEDVVEDEFYD